MHSSVSKTHESHYLLEKMIYFNLINFNITKGILTKYFAHYKTKEESESIIKDPFCELFLETMKNYQKKMIGNFISD